MDIRDAPALQACIGGIRRQRQPRCILDLSELSFVDCACLAVLAANARDIRAAGGTMELTGPHGAVSRILEVTGLLSGLTVHDTAEQATPSRARRSFIVPAVAAHRVTRLAQLRGQARPSSVVAAQEEAAVG